MRRHVVVAVERISASRHMENVLVPGFLLRRRSGDDAPDGGVAGRS